MNTLVNCLHCGQLLDLAQAAPRSQVQCPNCHGVLQVPGDPFPASGFSAAPRTAATGFGASPSLSRRRAAPAKDRSLLVICGAAAVFLACLAGIWGLAMSTPATRQNEIAQSSDEAAPPTQERLAQPAVPGVTAEPTPMITSAGSEPEQLAVGGDLSAPKAVNDQDAEVPPEADLRETPAKPAAASKPRTSIPSPVVTVLPGAGDPEDYSASEPTEEDGPQRTPAERRQIAMENRVRKLVQSRFHQQRRETRPIRGEPGDFFIVANYEMPLQTLVADLRFAVSEGVDPSVEGVVDYLVSTPPTHVRDFQVVARFASRQEAEAGIAVVRQRYDEAKQYQEQLLAYLQEQQRVRASSIRRC